MMRIFISYSRTRDAIDLMSNDLESLSHEVWWDKKELAGGQAWWKEIITNIENADLIIPALSPNFLNSDACRREINYAVALNKRLLPVLVQDIDTNLLWPSLAPIEFVDYRQPSRESLLRLITAIQKLPPPSPPPAVMPDPPPAPMSHTGQLAERVRVVSPFDMEEQRSILFDLKGLLGSKEDASAREVLRQLRDKSELARIQSEIDTLPGNETARPVLNQPPARTYDQSAQLYLAAASGRLAREGYSALDLQPSAVPGITFDRALMRRVNLVVVRWGVVVAFGQAQEPITAALMTRWQDALLTLGLDALGPGPKLGFGRGLALSCVLLGEQIADNARGMTIRFQEGNALAFYPVVIGLGANHGTFIVPEGRILGVVDFAAEAQSLLRP